MEELLLRGLLARDELDIIHQQKSATRYFMRKSSVLPARMAAISSLVNCSQVTYMMTNGGALDLGLNGGQQMGLAQTGAAVDEQGVIAPEVCRHSLRSSKRKLVGRPLMKFSKVNS